MKSTVDLLSTKERELLARLYESELYAPLKKLLELERNNIASKLLEIPSDDVINISKQQGRAANCKELNLTLKDNFKAKSDK